MLQFFFPCQRTLQPIQLQSFRGIDVFESVFFIEVPCTTTSHIFTICCLTNKFLFIIDFDSTPAEHRRLKIKEGFPVNRNIMIWSKVHYKRLLFSAFKWINLRFIWMTLWLNVCLCVLHHKKYRQTLLYIPRLFCDFDEKREIKLYNSEFQHTI